MDQSEDKIIEVVSKAQFLIQQLYDQGAISFNSSIKEDDIVSKFKRLASLLEKGLLIKDEFTQQKVKL